MLLPILLSISLIFFIVDGNKDEQLLLENYNQTWMYFSNGSDLPEIIYLTEPPKSKSTTELSSDILFELYTNASNNFPTIQFPFTVLLPLNDSFEEIIRQPSNQISEINRNFNNQLETKIIVHGWKSSTQSDAIRAIKDGYLKRGGYNLIAVNWANLASDIYYMRPAGRTIDIGRAIANVINYLVDKLKHSPKKIHLIGHSLGAHIMGYAGSFAKYRVKRITGLDPARPAFEDIAGPEGRLDRTDADFVDVIHSCSGILGYSAPIGHVDFYPNGGTAPQPGCGNLMHLFSACSHGRSHRYYAESINSQKGFWAYPCQSWQSFQNNTCSKTGGLLMGDKVPSQARGVYYLDTNSKREFAIGKM